MKQPIAALLLASLSLVSACKGGPSEAEIDKLKAARKEGALADALAGAKSSGPVRVRAARALVELAADAHFAQALGKLAADARAEVAAALAPELEQLLASPELARQVLAKDFLGLLVLAGDRGAAERAGPKLVAWLGADFQARSRLGKVSGSEILKKVGAPALPALNALLAAKKPGTEPLLVAKIIQGIGDAAGIATAADHVHALARTQAPKVPQPTLRALFTLGGPRAALHLAALAGDATLSYPTRRAAAEELRALGHPAAREAAARLALDGDGDQLVRESCLVYLEKVCDAATCATYAPGLWKALENASLVFESASALVKIAGADALPRLLKSFPVGRGYTAKGIEGIADDIARNIGAKGLAALRAAATGGKGPGRLVAFRALAKVGTAADGKLLDGLAGEEEVPEGWKFKSSYGTEARRAAEDLRKRR